MRPRRPSGYRRSPLTTEKQCRLTIQSRNWPWCNLVPLPGQLAALLDFLLISRLPIELRFEL